MDALAVDLPVIFPLHPRTRAVLKRSGIRPPPNVELIDPVGYLEMVALETHATAIATDSGGVQKEAYLSGVPCVTLRTETEWTETVEAGWNRVVGDDPGGLAEALADTTFMDRTRPHPSLYGDGRAAERIVAALESLEAARAAATPTMPSRTEAHGASRGPPAHGGNQPMIPIARPTMGNEEKELVWSALESGALAQGARVKELEERFAAFIGVPHAVATSSGTTALHLALLGYGIAPGDEVITVPFTFIASATSILYTGARPVFVDIGPADFAMDPGLVEAAITPRTRAIMPVSLYGQPADMPAITAIAERHGLAVIEDAAQSHGAAIGDRKSGSWGAGVFSFYPTKNMTTGEGGMVTTADAELAGRIRLLREHGMQVALPPRHRRLQLPDVRHPRQHRARPAHQAARLQRAAAGDRGALRRRAARRAHAERAGRRNPRLPPVHDPREPTRRIRRSPPRAWGRKRGSTTRSRCIARSHSWRSATGSCASRSPTSSPSRSSASRSTRA